MVIEAYRHLVDPVEDYRPGTVPPRVQVTCTVHVSEVLDLRTSLGRSEAGLTLAVLQSKTRDKDAYRQCQEVSAVAHQLGLHGLIAPAATQEGETLVLFPERLSPAETPTYVSMEHWDQLPADPRGHQAGGHLRLVR